MNKDYIHILVDYELKVSILQIVRRLKQETTFSLWRRIKEALLFGQMAILYVALVKEPVTRLYKGT